LRRSPSPSAGFVFPASPGSGHGKFLIILY
jgi:hypothetical protein